MPYSNPELHREAIRARYKRYREKQKLTNADDYKKRVKEEHDRAYAKIKADPIRWAALSKAKSEAHKKMWARPGYREERLECQRKYYKIKENRDRQNDLCNGYRTKNKDINRALFTEFKKNGCAICQMAITCCMDAHHYDSSIKKFTIGKALGAYKKTDEFITELAKCVCLCANCHRQVHAGLLVCPEPNLSWKDCFEEIDEDGNPMPSNPVLDAPSNPVI